MKSIIRKNLPFLVYIPIFLNFLLNFFNPNTDQPIKYLEIFDLISTMLLFILIIQFGKIISLAFKYEQISTGILIYLLSFFIFDNTILFLTTKLTFDHVFIVVNICWIVYFLIIKINLFKILKIIFSFLVINSFSFFFKSFIQINTNLIGDVKDIHYPHVKNIFENSYFYSINNPTLEGYTQLSSYIHALFNKLLFFVPEYNYYSSSTYIIFFLILFLIYEQDLKKEIKILGIAIASTMILNSFWISFLFFDSLMTEGILSYFLVVGILSVFKEVSNNSSNLKLLFFTIGFLYFAKQFISLLIILMILFYIFKKNVVKYSIFGLAGIIIKELSYKSHFSNLIKNYHLNEIDLIDFIFDLIFFRNLEFKNIYLIFNNLLIDKPYLYFLILMFFLAFLNYYLISFSQFEATLLVIILLNFLFIFILYISLWKTMELETPIRYMLNIYPLTLIYKLNFLNRYKERFA